MLRPRVIFAGTPDFALASLVALVESGIKPIAVLTQPDRPAGRGKQLQASPVKRYAIEQGIDVLQPATLRDEAVVAELAALEPDIMIVAAYGLILPQSVLDVPNAGCLNVHASLLPRWRGAAPILAAILAGDEKSGVCLMAMEAGLDSGAVYTSEAVTIGEHETTGELHDRLANIGGELLVRHLDEIINGAIDPIDQDAALATYAPKISTSDAEIDWWRPVTDVDRHVRAYNPVPGAWFMLAGERVKCWSAHGRAAAEASPGTVVAVEDDAIVVACVGGGLAMTLLQRPGKRRVSAREFAARFDLAGRQL